MGIFAVIIFLCFFSSVLDARPISYSGGSTLMALTNNIKDSVYFHYSPSYKYSVGVEHLKHKVFNQHASYLRFTYLLNRKNSQNSQRNLYFQSGISLQRPSAHFFGIHGDWETRRWFTGFGYKQEIQVDRNYSEQYAQIGFAPYLGEYGDLHTWFMLKTKKNTLLNDWYSYPVLKFFKGDLLIEFGYHKDAKWDTHLMYRF